jgi:hypothetical protein
LWFARHILRVTSKSVVSGRYSLFPGWNQSFFGDLHVQGNEGVMFCTRQKVILSRCPASDRDKVFNSRGN